MDWQLTWAAMCPQETENLISLEGIGGSFDPKFAAVVFNDLAIDLFWSIMLLDVLLLLLMSQIVDEGLIVGAMEIVDSKSVE